MSLTYQKDERVSVILAAISAFKSPLFYFLLVLNKIIYKIQQRKCYYNNKENIKEIPNKARVDDKDILTQERERPIDDKLSRHGLCGVVVKTPAWESKDPRFESRV